MKKATNKRTFLHKMGRFSKATGVELYFCSTCGYYLTPEQLDIGECSTLLRKELDRVLEDGLDGA